MTIDKVYTASSEVLKSKFIAILLPLNDADDFKKIYEGYKKEHKKARHIVYAYRVGNKNKSSDDGEPKGTAGHPLMELLFKKDLDNVALLVVRYFGGSKLGASRLLRTYLQVAVEAINNIN